MLSSKWDRKTVVVENITGFDEDIKPTLHRMRNRRNIVVSDTDKSNEDDKAVELRNHGTEETAGIVCWIQTSLTTTLCLRLATGGRRRDNVPTMHLKAYPCLLGE